MYTNRSPILKKGNCYLLTAGSVHVIPSLVPHSALALTDCKVIDSFSPARDDYR
jgi:hypothetical protein